MAEWWAGVWADVSAREITLEGSSLLATLYTAGIIAAMIEVRVLGKLPRKRIGRGPYNRASGGAIAVMAMPAFLALPTLAQSVASAVPLRGVLAFGVAFAGWVLFLGLVSLMIEFISLARSTDVDEPAEAPVTKVEVVGGVPAVAVAPPPPVEAPSSQSRRSRWFRRRKP